MSSLLPDHFRLDLYAIKTWLLSRRRRNIHRCGMCHGWFDWILVMDRQSPAAPVLHRSGNPNWSPEVNTCDRIDCWNAVIEQNRSRQFMLARMTAFLTCGRCHHTGSDVIRVETGISKRFSKGDAVGRGAFDPNRVNRCQDYWRCDFRLQSWTR